MLKTQISLPFLATDAHDVAFEYLLLKLTVRSALISIPAWAIQPVNAQDIKRVNLHLNGFSERPFEQFPLKGTGVKVDDHSSELGALYRIEFDQVLKGYNLLHKSDYEAQDKGQTNKLILQTIKDSLILKQGVLIYLGHFIPFLSRILEMNQKYYSQIKENFLNQMKERVARHIEKLEELYVDFDRLQKEGQPLYLELDFGSLKEVVQSEIDTLFFQVALGGPDEVLDVLKGSKEHYQLRSYQTYLQSIKNLENRLYANFNSLVMVYSHCLGSANQA